jgi:hypothetical protein
MAHHPGTCPKCQSPMEPGVLVDRGHADRPIPTQWVEGEPEMRYWTGLQTKGHEKFSVRTNRCTKCGFLESFAGPV